MSNSAGPSVVRDLADIRSVCSACGCLCDDIGLVLDRGRVIESINACPIGRHWFQAESSGVDDTSVPFLIQGRSAGYPEAIRKSAELLRASRAPVILGLTQTTIETVRAAAEVADKIGAVIDPGISGSSAARIHAFQRQGRVTATLGEVKNRADVIVFWGSDPVTTHPRHAERYSIDAKGRFRPDGRSGRTIIVVDETSTPTSGLADHVMTIAVGEELGSLWTMHAILLNRPMDAERVRASTGHSLEEWTRLVDRLKKAEYGAIFVDAKFGKVRRSMAAFEAMARFVRELNHVTRWVVLPLGGPGNPAGAEAVLSWQTGFANAVDLGSGMPHSVPGVTTAADRLTRREADLALIVADPLPGDLPDVALDHLGNIPRIVISPATASYNFEPTVRFSPGNPLLTSVGSIVRCDGVPLPLRAPLPTAVPSDREILVAISSKLDELGHSTRNRA